MLEEKYGSGTLAEVVAIAAFGTSLVNYVFFPSVALCGASGVVFAFILLSSFTSFQEGEIPLTFLLVTVFSCKADNDKRHMIERLDLRVFFGYR